MSTVTEVDDHELLSRARAGDQSAFRALVERYESQVAATVIGMLGRGPEAEDVGQATFIRFYRALDDFREKASIGTYLTRIAINLSLNALKRRKREQQRWIRQDEMETDPADSEAREPMESEETRRLVSAAINRLPPKFKTVVVLRMIRGFSTKETAAMLGVPTGTVLSRLSRAQNRLKEILAPVVGK